MDKLNYRIGDAFIDSTKNIIPYFKKSFVHKARLTSISGSKHNFILWAQPINKDQILKYSLNNEHKIIFFKIRNESFTMLLHYRRDNFVFIIHKNSSSWQLSKSNPEIISCDISLDVENIFKRCFICEVCRCNQIVSQ